MSRGGLIFSMGEALGGDHIILRPESQEMRYTPIGDLKIASSYPGALIFVPNEKL
jgi:hypothetical protein